MAKIKLNDRVLTFSSKYSCAVIAEASEKAPDTCMITGVAEDGTEDKYNPKFVVMANAGEECVDTYGVNFVTDDLDGHATVICVFDGTNADEVKANAYTRVGNAYTYLERIEEQIEAWKERETAYREAFDRALEE